MCVLSNVLTGKKATMINGDIILVTTAVLMMTIGVVETVIMTTLTAAASTVSSRHTA